MSPYADYFFILVVVMGLVVAGFVGFLMYRNSQRQPPVVSDRTDCFPMNDEPPAADKRPPAARR